MEKEKCKCLCHTTDNPELIIHEVDCCNRYVGLMERIHSRIRKILLSSALVAPVSMI